MAKKILLVDDNATLRENLCKLLEERGHEVKTTGADKEIWDILKNDSFDLMVLDLILPEKNTSVILGGLKSASPHTRIIIYSGFDEYENSPYIHIADAFLSKSKGPEVLIATIEKLLGL